MIHKPPSKSMFTSLPRPSHERLVTSLDDRPFNIEQLAAVQGPAGQQMSKTIFYLAYGSNLCSETFRDVRGIRPLSQINVVVPSLRLTFDLPGIPYSEPCFANTAARRISDTPRSDHSQFNDCKDQYKHDKHNENISNNTDNYNDQLANCGYHKSRWHKGLVGVVYEVTRTDYAHIIATEGGGAAYSDVLVDCYVLQAGHLVPTQPDTQPFRAHTLFAHPTNRVSRSDPNYAQPSERYKKLITHGAAECCLPQEYQDYLHDIRTYKITSKRQATGKAIFLTI